ncbi:MAG: 23S rRNA (adenine(2503)-C(2))-methyltransferase RlmN [Firmicutes bacterium]|nr:23S rRNA (adenine(2503)-C(2))-methyltransferase RlmN [Bacillota bacterium]
MESIYNKSFDELVSYFESIGQKKFKATQVFEWLYIKRVKSFDEMSNIKKDIIDRLKEDFVIEDISLEKVERDIEVNKYLFTLNDNNHIESVLMRHDYGNSICISSQVGCNMGCRFCESGRLKKVRNLTAGEMVEQILKVEEDINERITHVVIMGIGEPFDNYDNFKRFVEIVNYQKGINIGSRHITVSTCGIIPKIREFSEFPYQVNLAISLHAPNNEIRDKLMPINKVYPIQDLIKEIRNYIKVTNRRVTFEYILLSGINDSESCANELCDLVKGLNCYINLIPYNETNNSGYKRSKKDTISNFYDIIKKRKINVTIRREFGSNISAACGQLRSKKEDL